MKNPDQSKLQVIEISRRRYFDLREFAKTNNKLPAFIKFLQGKKIIIKD